MALYKLQMLDCHSVNQNIRSMKMNSPFVSAYINITFEPCDNEMCVDIGREVGIPLDDDTLYDHRLFNYTILNEKLVLGRPRYDTVIQDDSTGTFLVVDNDGMLPTAFDI